MESCPNHRADWLPTTLASAGYEPFGAPHLSGQIARWYSDRGLPTYPEQIVVTPGALAALGVALAATVKPGERVLVDSPTYPGALGAVRGARARPVSVALDGAWNVDAWTVALRRSGARAAYLIPDFHNPTGLLMPTRLRGRLASLLRERGCTAIIDETLVELGFGGDPRPEPWAVQDPGAITIGSLSKLLWGGVRIGWLRLPAELVDLGRATAVQRSLGASALDQLVATTFLEDPGPIISEVTARMRRARDLWLGLLVDQLPQWRADPPEGGLALWVELPRRVATRFALAASGQRLVVAPGPTFSADHTHANRLRLPLTLPPEVIPEATTRLVAAWEGLGTQDAPEGFDTLTL